MLDERLGNVLRTTKAHIKRLESLGVITVKDFLTYFPWRYSDESEFSKIAELVEGQQMTVKGYISNIFMRKTQRGKMLIKAKLSDETGEIDVVWFNQTYLSRLLKENMEIVLTGKLKWTGTRGEFASPKYEIPGGKQELVHTGRVVPVYHETYGLTSKWIREKIRPLLYMSKFFTDPLPNKFIEDYDLMPLSEAISEVHFPSSSESLKRARYRLGFEELFLIQCRVLQRKFLWKESSERFSSKIDVSKKCVQGFLEKLPFSLTNAQIRALDEIFSDIGEGTAMSRLLEGDVGSGKTVVAAASVYVTVKSGMQALVMAPTEILARQHYQNMYGFFKDFGFNVQFLAGSMTKSQKEEVVQGLKSGTVDLVVGTHALIQDKVGFKNLGLAVIDEQHRFGVEQRAIVKSFGTPHLLSMTATPIPRTLALTLYGDQDLSIIDEKPAGRQEIVTRVVPENKRSDAYDWITNQVEHGRQVFVVCPLIEESEAIEVKSATDEFDRLSDEVFPQFKVGLLHGKMKQADKDMIMEKFSNKEIDILVATTVIEVGIDVPNASIMVIEAADRFGLAQLHQLRGRVGRGEHQSYCFLFPEGKSEGSKERMKAMVDYSDGFKLAEIDLELRGPGEVYGVRQSGIPDLKMATLSDSKLVKSARDAAEEILTEDPYLKNYPHLANLVAMGENVIDY